MKKEKRGFFSKFLGIVGKEEEKTPKQHSTGPIKSEFKHVGGISKEEDMIITFNVDVDMMKLSKEAMKKAGFKKKDMQDKEFMKQVISTIMNEKVLEEENKEGA